MEDVDLNSLTQWCSTGVSTALQMRIRSREDQMRTYAPGSVLLWMEGILHHLGWLKHVETR